MRYPPLPARSTWTVADLEALPADGNRYELLDGELLVTPLPAPGHQHISSALAFLLTQWCRANTEWTVFSFGGIYINEANWFEPDVCVYSMPRSAGWKWRDIPPPIFAVEILSPSTASRDRQRKRPTYLAHGVREVWLIDEHTRTVERWTGASDAPDVMLGAFTWTPDPALPTLSISDDELFGPPS